jgi:hypothetical protein
MIAANTPALLTVNAHILPTVVELHTAALVQVTPSAEVVYIGYELGLPLVPIAKK